MIVFGFELLAIFPLLLITIYAVYEHGLPRHRKAAIVALVFLTAVFLGCVAFLSIEIGWRIRDGVSF